MISTQSASETAMAGRQPTDGSSLSLSDIKKLLTCGEVKVKNFGKKFYRKLPIDCTTRLTDNAIATATSLRVGMDAHSSKVRLKAVNFEAYRRATAPAGKPSSQRLGSTERRHLNLE